jgi:hypothetical protein
MQSFFKWIARLAGIVGVAAIVVAIVGRLAGAYLLGSFQVGTILQAGMAAMLLACLAYLVALVETVGR